MSRIRKQTKFWKTKDGRKIQICDMSDSHLNNAINFLKQQAEVALYTGIDYNDYLDTREWGAPNASMDPNDYLPEIYENLLLERERRESLSPIKKFLNSF